MVFHIITLFPESFDSYIKSSIIGRAITDKKIKVKFYNPRDYISTPQKLRGVGKRRRVDQKPYAGGPGMVIEAPAVIKAVEAASKKLKVKSYKLIWLSPSGKQFTNTYAKGVAKKFDHLIIICGRYEGIDERVRKIFKAESVSIGPYVLTGGELPAMVILDTVSRQVKGVLGKIESLEESRIASPEVYTRPEVFKYKGKKYRVPKVLLSGDHKKIEEWKKGRNSR